MKSPLITLLLLAAAVLLLAGCATQGVPTSDTSVPVYDVIKPIPASDVNALQKQLNP